VAAIIMGMMTALITRGAIGVIIAIMIAATTHAMTAITIVVTHGDIRTDIIATGITMTDMLTFGARIESVTQSDDLLLRVGTECGF